MPQAHRNNVRRQRDAPSVTPDAPRSPERLVDFRPRTIFRVLLIVLLVAVTLEVVWIARHVLAWVVIALFLALALDPLVGVIQRRTRLGRGAAIGVAYVIVAIVIAGVGGDVHAEADRRGRTASSRRFRATSRT